MKKMFVTAMVALLGLTAHAQAGQTAVGVNLGYPTELKTPSIGLKAWYGITNPIRVQASADYYLEKDNVKSWDVNLDVHYLLPLGNLLKLYPLAGLTYMHSKVGEVKVTVMDKEITAGGASAGNLGANLGAGLQFDLTNSLAINAEAKYQFIKDSNQTVITAGIAYKF